MKGIRTYIPVGCDFVDLIEIKAIEGLSVNLQYRNNKGLEFIVNTRLKTWKTSQKVEYLITAEDLEIRLDDIISIDGVINKNSCNS